MGVGLDDSERDEMNQPFLGSFSHMVIHPRNNVWNAYNYKELAKATGYFSEDYSLGTGAHGAVYQATLSGIGPVAIKKFFYGPKIGKEFGSEVSVLAKLQHPNLVKMLGYCCDGANNKLLVLEFMPNKSLASHLHVDCDEHVLDWSKRMKVASGSANGIAFLHSRDQDQGKFIHRDIKPENILLDPYFEPKIADFGLARSMQYNKSHISTDAAGTTGYVAPECKRPWRRVTEKSDVFSFGIILLEFITGKEQIVWENGEETFLSKWVVEKLKYALRTGNFNNLVDVKLKKNYKKKEMRRMIYCAAASVYKPEKSRPTMSQIADILVGKKGKEMIWHRKVDKAYLRDPYEA